MLPSLCALLSLLWPVKCTGIVLTSVRPLAVSMLSKHTLSQEHWPFTTSTCLRLRLRLFHVPACLSASICSSVRLSVFFFRVSICLLSAIISCPYASACVNLSTWQSRYTFPPSLSEFYFLSFPTITITHVSKIRINWIYLFPHSQSKCLTSNHICVKQLSLCYPVLSRWWHWARLLW